MRVRIAQKSAFSQLSQQVILIDIFVEATGWIVDSAGMSNQMGEFHRVHNEMRSAILWLSLLLTDGWEKIPLHNLPFLSEGYFYSSHHFPPPFSLPCIFLLHLVIPSASPIFWLSHITILFSVFPSSGYSLLFLFYNQVFPVQKEQTVHDKTCSSRRG